MAPRFFIEQPIRTEEVQLSGAEAHHLANVMRCRKGDRMVVFDGSGKEYQAEVIDIERHAVRLSIKSSAECDRELAGELVVASAMPKGDRQRFLIEKLVELGVTTLIPLIANRAVAQSNEHTRSRLERYVIESSKQCGRNRLMTIADGKTCEDHFGATNVPTKILAHPSGQDLASVSWTSPISIAIGPEGGFTENEIRIAHECGWQPVNLGPRILRIESAAIFLSAIAGASLGNANRLSSPQYQTAGAPTPRIHTT